MGSDSERWNIFINDAILREAFEFCVYPDASGEWHKPFRKISQPNRLLSVFGRITQAILLSSAPEVALPLVLIHPGQQFPLLLFTDVIVQQFEAWYRNFHRSFFRCVSKELCLLHS